MLESLPQVGCVWGHVTSLNMGK